MSRLKLILRPVIGGLLTLLLISVVTFGATNVRSPEFIAINTLGRDAATPELIERFIKDRGLDRPVVERYIEWLQGAVRGDWGNSIATGRPIGEDLAPRFVRTLQITLLSLAAAIPTSLGLGVYMAARGGTRRDVSLVTGTVVLAAMPEFVKGVVLMLIFSVYLGWLPVESSGLAFGTGWERIVPYALPTMTLAVHMLPYIVRMTRASAREAFNASHTRMAVLLGLPRRRVIWTYAMRPSAGPLVNVIALNVMWLISGVIVVENLFGFPGLGRLLVSAIQANDTPTIQAITLILGGFFIGISLTADLLVQYFNPRLRASTETAKV